MNNLIVINLLGGPGTGKSTLAAKIFATLKEQQIATELVNEFPKELTWEGRYQALQNQIYVFGNQHQKIKVLEGKVQVAVIEGSLLNSLVYNTSPELEKLIWTEYKKMDNINIFLERTVPYQTDGRIQSLEDSQNKDQEIRNILQQNEIGYITLDPQDPNILTNVSSIIRSKIQQ